MQTVILAGGLGTRLRPLTETIPKPMLEVCGKPFLEHQLELLRSFDFRDILVLAGYLGEKIEEYFSDGRKMGLRISYSFDKTPMGTGGALKLAGKLLDDRFVLLNGDTLLPIDYAEFAGVFIRHNCSAMIVAYDNELNIAPNNLIVDDNGSVLSYNKDASARMTHLDAGVIAVRKSVLDLIPADKVCSFEREVFVKLVEAGDMAAYVTGTRFVDMGTFAGLQEIAKVLQ
jgi:N-acetyl-alpha-D-muramate 1-phosphate uridylyltransferase